MIPNAGDGWKAPLKDPRALEVKIHRGDILSVPGEIDNKECCEILIKRFPQAVAMELEGLGKHTVTQILHEKSKAGCSGYFFPHRTSAQGPLSYNN